MYNQSIAQRRAKMTAKIERERGFRAYAHALSHGMGKAVVVVIGDKDVTKFRYRSRPHREFMRVLNEVTNGGIGEYHTQRKRIAAPRGSRMEETRGTRLDRRI